MAYTITKRRTTKGIAFDLYFRWKGQRYRPLLGYDLSSAQAQQCAIELIHKLKHFGAGRVSDVLSEACATASTWN